MIQHRVRQQSKHHTPFPFSAYVIRSYSSEPNNVGGGMREAEGDNKNPEAKKELQEFDSIMKGYKIKERLINMPFQVEISKRSQNLCTNEVSSEIKIRTCEYEDRIKRQANMRTYHTCKNATKNGSLSSINKKHISDNKSIHAHFRNQIVSLLTLLDRKEDFFNCIKGKKESNVIPMKSNEIQEKLEKLLESKGKDKGRQKFNFLISEQLRSLKYKGKQTTNFSPSKKGRCVDREEEEESASEENEVQEGTTMDIQTWKRNNGIAANQKVFIIKSGYSDLRKELLNYGWYENTNIHSPFYNLKWTTKMSDINFFNMRAHQSVNHFNNNHHLTSKYGLTRRLRTLALCYGVDADRFYPRCYDLGDQVDFENFIENFKFGFSETVAKRFLVDKKRYEGLLLKIWTTYSILKRRAKSFSVQINEINRGNFLAVTSEEWEIITETSSSMLENYLVSDVEKSEILKCERKKELEALFKESEMKLNLESPEFEQNLYQILDKKIQSYLSILKNNDPQVEMNGYRNVWIVKPNFMSRGRGIRCYNNLYDISDHCFGQNTQYVVQKYIENPLVIEGKKFDIRQWVLVQDFCPPKIWFYDECYIRFCADEFSLDNINNRFIHLTNNSVQKYSKKGNIEKSMWTMGELARYLGEEKWRNIQEKIKNIVVWSLKSCEGCVTGKKGSCELIGYDFMIDENLNPWLIEINMSPSMDYSTPVTKKLVKMVLSDTAKVLSMNKRNRDTGGFKCIYESNNDLRNYNIYNF